MPSTTHTGGLKKFVYPKDHKPRELSSKEKSKLDEAYKNIEKKKSKSLEIKTKKSKIIKTKKDAKEPCKKNFKINKIILGGGIFIILIVILFMVVSKTKVVQTEEDSLEKIELLENDGMLNIPLIYQDELKDSFNEEETTGEEIELVPQIISLKMELVTFCTSQFLNNGIFDLEKTNYQEDLSSASDWVRNNYENSALTQEQKEHNINYIIENQLLQSEYPIVITSGSKEVSSQMVEHGFYYCNENGVI